jgi:uncharacterized protein (DUF433 family)
MESTLIPRITVEEDKCGGRPCIRGRRIRVTDIISLLASHASREEILSDFPLLEDADIRAALTQHSRLSER